MRVLEHHKPSAQDIFAQLQIAGLDPLRSLYAIDLETLDVEAS